MLVEDSETSADELALSSALMRHPVEELKNSNDELNFTSFPHPNKGEISSDDLSLTIDIKLTISKKRPASRIWWGHPRIQKTKKGCREE